MYSFRLRFDLSGRSGLNCDDEKIVLYSDEGGREVYLCSRQSDTTIKEDTRLVLRAAGWESEEAAKQAGERYVDSLIYALAEEQIGGDLGDRAPKGYFTEAGLEALEESYGRRVLNDEHGLMVFSTDPPPLFANQEMSGRRGVRTERFETSFGRAADSGYRVDDRQCLAFEFFSASFFTDYADARFLLLFMAVEALIVQQEREPEVASLVEGWKQEVREAEGVDKSVKRSLRGSLNWLKVESIRGAGRRLAATQATGDYSGMSGEDLFLGAYDLRSRLVHGHSPAPTREDVGSMAAPLEDLTSDLICRSMEEAVSDEGENGSDHDS